EAGGPINARRAARTGGTGGAGGIPLRDRRRLRRRYAIRGGHEIRPQSLSVFQRCPLESLPTPGVPRERGPTVAGFFHETIIIRRRLLLSSVVENTRRQKSAVSSRKLSVRCAAERTLP